MLLEVPSLCTQIPRSTVAKDSSWDGSLSLTEHKIYKSAGATDASTQIEDDVSKSKARGTCTREICGDKGLHLV